MEKRRTDNGLSAALTKGRDTGEEDGRRAVIDGVMVALLPSHSSSSFSGGRFTSCAAVVHHWTEGGSIVCGSCSRPIQDRESQHNADDSLLDVLLCFVSPAFGWPTSDSGAESGARRNIVCVLYFSRVVSQMDCGTDKLMDEISDNRIAAVQHVER